MRRSKVVRGAAPKADMIKASQLEHSELDLINDNPWRGFA
jgi:hypothetical protein